jgi:hypothetical protein
MSRLYKLLLGIILALSILACNLLSAPVSDIENAASTAEAFASNIPVETIESLATAVPVDTLEALPSVIPDIGDYFDPTGTPAEQWNGIPVMPQATVGEEFSDNVYSYTVPVTATDVQTFYNEMMEGLGWTSPFGFQASEDGGIMFFQNENDFLSITITPDRNDSNSVDVILQKG